ncbi:MAG: trypsin-like peptidase domain-containing protein [Dinoroseobacter sp.]|nr:trypsin-like peptidase domain-containing protein [Dinoroseobacter sp.]
MRCIQGTVFAILISALVLGSDKPAQALPPETLASVVSVLPVWPGRAQGGTGGPPGVAPEGSGVVLRPNIVATAWHVIEPADRIDVRLSDGRVLPAELVGQDAASDIALLRVEADLPPIIFATDPDLADPVCAIGNAYGFGLSVTCGVVSALGVSNAGFNPVEDFVQTDAAANPGTSGGALVDPEGQLVGMISAIFASGAETNIGMNFAVSAPLLERVSEALLDDGTVRYPQPGWRLALPDRDVLARIAAPEVRVLEADGPAAQAGVQSGDLIVTIGPRRVYAPRDVIAALALVPQDASSVEVTIEREGSRQTLSLPIAPQAGIDEQAGTSEQLGDCPHATPVCLMRQAVFPISAFDPLGSATRISEDLLVTNRHVIGDRPDAVVYTPDGPRGARVVPSAYTGDLVLLHITGLPAEGYVPPLDAVLQESTEFFAVGADVARQEVRVFDPGPLLLPPAEGAPLGRVHVGARMQPGVSGGALVDANGALTGIAVGGGDGRFEAIPLRDVQVLLELQEDGDAASITSQLGEAFVRCADLLSASAPDPTSVADACGNAQNQGQLLEAGRTLARLGDIDGAVALHQAAVDQVPNSINARISLLVSLQLGARFEEMTEHARWLTEVAADDPQALRFAIQSGVWGGDPELAEAGYQALLTADPRQAEAARRFIDAAPPRPPRR